MIQRYLESRYVRGGREWPELDCFGLVRLARAELYGAPMMPLCTAAVPGNCREITRAVSKVAWELDMSPCGCAPGSVATAWAASLCIHVGLVVEADGRLWVLETDEPTGPCLTPVKDFESRYTRVVYYAD